MKRFRISALLVALISMLALAEFAGAGPRLGRLLPNSSSSTQGNALNEGFITWQKNASRDSFVVSAVGAGIDTTNSLNVDFLVKAGGPNPLSAAGQPAGSDSTTLLYGQIFWTNAANGDTMSVAVQYAPDSVSTWTTLQTYTVGSTGNSNGTLVPFFGWNNRVATMNTASRVRAIVTYSDISVITVKSFKIRPLRFGYFNDTKP
jgi:hypothetical protein